MNLSALPSGHLLAASGLTPVGTPALDRARLDATKASSGQFTLPLGQLDGGTLHVSPHAPSWTPAQYEEAFLNALCTQQDGQR